MTPAGTEPAVHLETAGDAGPLLLCLHGIGSSSAAFAPQLAGLRDHVRVIAWDAPGYAKSADPDGPLDLDGFADAAADVIRSHGSSAHVLGVSWGGVIAVRLATRHPELVDSLVLADSSAGSGTDEAKAAGMRARAEELAALGPRAFAEKRGPRLVSDRAPAELVRRTVDTMADAVRLPGYGYAAESMAATDHTADLPKIDIPTLVLGGDEDGVTGVPASQVLAGGIPGAVFVTIRGAGHLANQERPEAFNAWVESFIHITERLRNHL